MNEQEQACLWRGETSLKILAALLRPFRAAKPKPALMSIVAALAFQAAAANAQEAATCHCVCPSDPLSTLSISPDGSLASQFLDLSKQLSASLRTGDASAFENYIGTIDTFVSTWSTFPLSRGVIVFYRLKIASDYVARWTALQRERGRADEMPEAFVIAAREVAWAVKALERTCLTQPYESSRTR